MSTESEETLRREHLKAQEAVIRCLARRDHSELELRQKLSDRFSEEALDLALHEAKARGWLKPPEEIAERAAQHWSRRQKSHRYIQDQLRKRGLPATPRSDEEELEKIRTLLARKFDLSAPLSFEDKGKAYRYLKYRGFDDALIRKILKGAPF